MIVALFLTALGHAANLSPEAAKAWEDYVQRKNVTPASAREEPFIPIDDAHPDAWNELRSGKIFVRPAGPSIPKRVPSGLIHDWIAVAFIPDATIPQVMAVVRDYDHYKDRYHPAVVDSKLLSRNGDVDRFTLLLRNKAVVETKAEEGDYRVSYFRLDDHRMYSIAESTRIQEIEHYADAGAHLLPEGEGAGLMWRVDTITRFEEYEGGVLVQLEVMVLSRTVPGALCWMIDPIIRRVSRESLQLSLEQTRSAVQSALAQTEASGGKNLAEK
ncbi:MAG TPA: hypothetical protein VMU80_00735 [Bryobacteraceae bacterium]|nr:hypothetical protein [Bryobacteraceae bacterium]